MYKLSLIFFWVVTFSTIHAQPVQTIKIKTRGPARTLEEFQVLKSDPGVRHGFYKKYKRKKLIESGFHKNNEKDSAWNIYGRNGKVVASGTYRMGLISGEWSYFDINGMLYHKYNHDEERLTFTAKEGDDISEFEQLALFIGGEYYMNTIIDNNLVYPEEALLNGKTATVYVTFIVDETGNTIDAKSIKPVGNGFDEEAVRLVNLLGKSWIPGVKDGKKVKVTYNLPLKFNLK